MVGERGALRAGQGGRATARHCSLARTIARMPARMAAGSRGHASTTAARSGSVPALHQCVVVFLLQTRLCNTLSYMETTLTIRLPSDLKRQLDALSRRTHRSASELVRESLRRFIASEQIAAVRKMAMPLAEAQGFVTDEDIFKAVS